MAAPWRYRRATEDTSLQYSFPWEERSDRSQKDGAIMDPLAGAPIGRQQDKAESSQVNFRQSISLPRGKHISQARYN